MPPFQRRPPTSQEIEETRRHRDYIKAHLEKGDTPRLISRQLSVPIGAIEVVMEDIGQGKVSPGAPASDGGEGHGPTASGQSPPSGPSLSGSAPTGPGTPPPNPVGGQSYSYPPPSSPSNGPTQTPSPIGAAPPPVGPYESPAQGLHQLFRNVLIYAGLPPSKAEGIVLSYSYSDMRNLPELKRIMSIAGCRPYEIDFAVDMWGKEIKRFETDEGVAPSTTDASADPLKFLTRKYITGGNVGDSGAGTGADQSLLEKDRELTRRRIELEIKEKEVDIARRERELAARQPGQPLTPDSNETVMLTLEIGGVPVQKRVKVDEIAAWQAYIPKRRDSSIDEPPAWAKEILEQQRRDREAKIEREREERLESRFKALEGHGGGRGDPEVERLRDEMAKDRAERQHDREMAMAAENKRLADQIEKLSERVESQSDPDYASRVLQRQRERAVKFGMVPKEEVSRLTEEQIELKAKADAERVKTQAQTEMVAVATDKLKKTGAAQDLVHGIIDAGAPQMAVDFLKKTLNGSGNQGGDHTATEAEIAAEAERLSRAAEAEASSRATQPEATS